MKRFKRIYFNFLAKLKSNSPKFQSKIKAAKMPFQIFTRKAL